MRHAPAPAELRFGVAAGGLYPTENLFDPFTDALRYVVALGGNNPGAAPTGFRAERNVWDDAM